MTPGHDPPAWTALARECGLTRPRAGWLRDAHLLFALLAAVPVWLALPWWAGPSMRAPAGILAWLAFVLLQPLAEELLFRGVLQGQLLSTGARRRLGPITVANLLTTALFVAAHFVAQPPAWALAVVLPSLVFGHLRERLGSLWPAFAMHALYNAGFFLVAALLRH